MPRTWNILVGCIFASVCLAQAAGDGPGVGVDPGGALIHRAAVPHPPGPAGTLDIEATLNANGEVADAHVVSGPAELRKEALESVLQWHYQPGPAEVRIAIRFNAAPRIVSTHVLHVGISAVPPASEATIAAIQFFGFSPEAEQELRERLPVHEGEMLTIAGRAKVSAAVKQFDTHALAQFGLAEFSDAPKASAPQVTIRISVGPSWATVPAAPNPKPAAQP